MRGRIELGSGLYAAAYADVGGFGLASHLTWQAYGILAYNFNDQVSAQVGYRHLSTDYKNDGFVFDVDLSGPIAGIGFRF